MSQLFKSNVCPPILVFAVMLKKYGGEEGSGVDMQKMFGFIGLFTLFGAWWLSKNLAVPLFAISNQS
jgi:hypothetical protein